MAEWEKEEKVQLLEEQEAHARKEFLNIISKIILQYSECMEVVTQKKEVNKYDTGSINRSKKGL